MRDKVRVLWKVLVMKDYVSLSRGGLRKGKWVKELRVEVVLCELLVELVKKVELLEDEIRVLKGGD